MPNIVRTGAALRIDLPAESCVIERSIKFAQMRIVERQVSVHGDVPRGQFNGSCLPAIPVKRPSFDQCKICPHYARSHVSGRDALRLLEKRQRALTAAVQRVTEVCEAKNAT